MSEHQSTKLKAFSWLSMTPLGTPVEPDVYRMYARSPAARPSARAGAWLTAWLQVNVFVGEARTGRVFMKKTAAEGGGGNSGHSSSTAAQEDARKTTFTSQSASIDRLRAAGAAWSAGTYAARAFMMPKKAIMACAPFGTITPTRSPGFTPCAIRKPAILSA